MSLVAFLGRSSRPVFVIRILGVLLLPLVGIPATADPPRSEPPAQRVAVGKCLSPTGTLLAREASAKTWRAVPQQGDVFTGDHLLALPGDQATIGFKEDAARLTLWGNVPEFSAAPVLESAVVLHAAPADAVDLTLERGRIVLAKGKGKEPTKVGLHFHDQTWGLVLEAPDSEVAVELYGHWPPGVPFHVKSEPGEAPVAALQVFVLKGQVALKRDAAQYSLQGPPGPAFFQWNSVTGSDVGPKRRDKLPPWAEREPRTSPAAPAFRAAVERQRRQLGGTVSTEMLGKGLSQDDSAGRQLAVDALAALDDVAPVVAALANAHRDVRDTAALALQHWIGRGPAQDGRLYQFLTGPAQFTPAQAETCLHLLHDFSRDDLDRPETFETLIAYLRHRQTAVRALAAWYLYRLAPAGQKIAYDPTGPEAEREKAYQEWKRLIPQGKLPSRAKPK